jgi:hypothetical protein
MRKRIIKISTRVLPVFLIILVLVLAIQPKEKDQNPKLSFGISFSEKLSKKALDGRMLLMISTEGTGEPRFQISDGPDTQLIFGINVDGLKPGDTAVFDSSVFGYPLKSISEIPAGEYWVQGLLHIYETFHRSDGHTVKLPMDRGEGQRWNRAPGNLYSTPKKVHIDPTSDGTIKIILDKKIPPIPPPRDTKYIKHVKIQSKLLTEFWGRPMHLGACVLLPEGFDEHPEARYPLVINHGHFPYTFSGSLSRNTITSSTRNGQVRISREWSS